MNNNGLGFIIDINPKKDSWKVKVRINHMQKQSYRLDTMLMDERVMLVSLFKLFNYVLFDISYFIVLFYVFSLGDKMQATVNNVLILTFDNLLEENIIVFINKFVVVEMNEKILVIRHAYKINFYHNTTVNKVMEFYGPMYEFSFVPFDDIIVNQFISYCWLVFCLIFL